jgi:hypothetical protein
VNDGLFLDLFADRFRTISSGQGREFEGSEGEVLVGVGLAGNTRCWAVDDGLCGG